MTATHRRPGGGMALAFTGLLALTLCVYAATAAAQTVSKANDWSKDPIQVTGSTYYYLLFNSSASTNVVDGPTGTGMICAPAFVGTSFGPDAILFSDMCKSGSAIRFINAYGVFTLTGSLTETGLRDGSPDVALFGGVLSGNHNECNGITSLDNEFYMADTTNNAIRSFTASGFVSTYIDTSVVEQRPLSNPEYVTMYRDQNRITNLIISDSDNERIVFSTIPDDGDSTPPVLTVLAKGFTPGPLAISSDSKFLYYVNRQVSNITIVAYQLGLDVTYNLGDPHYTGYVNSLTINSDANELLYYGFVNDVWGIYALSITATASTGPQQRPTLKFAWPTEFGTVRTIIPRGGTSGMSVIVLTSQIAYVLSDGPTTPSMEDSFLGRHHGIAAFPADALPTTDPCQMSQLYHAMRTDAAVAFGTEDYLTQFAPFSNPALVTRGSVNVSMWCGNITGRFSTDESILILDFWGPWVWTKEQTQKALDNCSWTMTRRFLAELRECCQPNLGPFCYYNCAEKCETYTASEKLCIDYRMPPRCNDVCRGAVASSIVMGATLVVLLVLSLISPANLFRAVIMVPVF